MDGVFKLCALCGEEVHRVQCRVQNLCITYVRHVHWRVQTVCADWGGEGSVEK